MCANDLFIFVKLFFYLTSYIRVPDEMNSQILPSSFLNNISPKFLERLKNTVVQGD